MKVVYLAHALRGDKAGNLRRARAWFRWAIAQDVVVVMDWVLLAEEAPEFDNGDAWQPICLELLERCDEIWLVGGRVSEGMTIELHHATMHGLRVRDLTDLGAEPPAISLTLEAKAG